jgi:hypothetical protein
MTSDVVVTNTGTEGEQPKTVTPVAAPAPRRTWPAYEPVPETPDGLLRMPVCKRVESRPSGSRGVDTASEGRTR